MLTKVRLGWRRSFIAICLASCAVNVGATPLSPTSAPPPGFLNELVVEFDPIVLKRPVDAIVNDVATNPNSPSLAQFGQPSRAQLLMTLRYSDEALSTLQAEDPIGHLQNTVILHFPDDESTSRAVMTLARSGAVKSISRNSMVSFSTDPLIPVVSGSSGDQFYQWGLYALDVIQTSNLTGVWAKTRGSAYAALLDNGIQTSPNVHEDLAANYRKQFSYNYGYTNDGYANGSCGAASTPENLDEQPASTCSIPGYAAGHGTHTAGLVAARNGNGLGGSGVCQSCSFAEGRISAYIPTNDPPYGANNGYIATGLSDMALRGMQVINNSFGGQTYDCTNTPAVCSSLTTAYARDIVVVASSGNAQSSLLDFPAKLFVADGTGAYQAPGVIAVGGLTYYQNSQIQFWNGVLNSNFGSNYSTDPSTQQFVAPAERVISSVYTGFDWNSSCGDNTPSGFMVGYGDCTGTSMSAPQVTGLVGLMRSVDPLKSRLNIRNILAATSNTTSCTDTKCALGTPDATAAVTAALGGSNVLNRTSPLFTYYSSRALDHFYTYIPQMAMSAMTKGALRPQPTNGHQIYWVVTGAAISQYPHFPTNACNQTGCSNTPRAIAIVFTTHVNPQGGPDLAPLYRMSYKCGDELLTVPPNPANPICQTTPDHLSHFYSTDETAVRLYTGYDLNGVKDPNNPGLGYALDGIEGFIFPSTLAQPAGTVKLCRKYDASRDDYVLFPGSGTGGTDCSATTDGYTGGNYNTLVGGTDWIGWVYPVGTTYGPQPSNALPTVSLTSPPNNSVYTPGQAITITASASDSDGSIASVRFFANEQLIGIRLSSPFSITWTTAPSSSNPYLLTAVAVDNRGAVTTSAQISVTVNGLPTLANPSFEVPVFFPGTYSYGTTGASWTFVGPFPTGGSGISANGSAFTNQNPNAPDGAQVAFIQGANPISQVINFPVAGTFHFKFRAAQRYGNASSMQIQFLVDGSQVDPLIQPTDINYISQTTGSFTVTSGNHTISFVGLDSNGQDITVFLDKMQLLSP